MSMSTGNDPRPRRPIRSFVLRGGRLTEAQEKAIGKYWEQYVISYRSQLLPLDAMFFRAAPLVVEIGFGMGDSLLETAIREPQRNFLGIEVHKPGIGKLLQGIAASGIENVRIINHDASEVMAHCIPDGSVDVVQIFFPDPWHKKKHNKRRLVQPEFAMLLAEKLVAGGKLYLATDWQPYAKHMLEVVNGCPLLNNLSPDNGYMENRHRPVTKFERRGLKLGHGVWDLVLERKRLDNHIQ